MKKQILNNWIKKLFLEKMRFDKNRDSIEDLQTDEEIGLMYLVTIHFRTNTNDIIKNQAMLEQYVKTYFHFLLKRIIGVKYNKKPIYQPLSLFAFDVAGSRYKKNFSNPSTPHIHGLVLLHPTTIKNMQNANQYSSINDYLNNIEYEVPQIESVTYVQCGNKETDIDAVISYILKYATHLDSRDKSYSPYFILPQIDSNRYAFYKYITKMKKNYFDNTA